MLNIEIVLSLFLCFEKQHYSLYFKAYRNDNAFIIANLTMNLK